ncbi:MAG: hypothetical protein AAFY64_06230, partial [Pseudomonadota bacterium]
MKRQTVRKTGDQLRAVVKRTLLAAQDTDPDRAEKTADAFASVLVSARVRKDAFGDAFAAEQAARRAANARNSQAPDAERRTMETDQVTSQAVATADAPFDAFAFGL